MGQRRIHTSRDCLTDPTVAKHLQQALIQMEYSEAGSQMLQGIRIQGWEAANDQDWDDVRGLQIQKLSY